MVFAKIVWLWFLQRRKSPLIITMTVTLFLRISAITWNKLPTDPVYGILGENVTLEWNFTLATTNETLNYFMLLRNRHIPMIEYSDVKGLIPYESYKGRVGLVRNGIPSFIFINLKKNDEGLYCCQVNFIKIETNNGDFKMKCTQLKILVRPTVVSISRNQTLNQTNDVTLSCNATGEPSPNITWSTFGNKESILTSSSFLQLKNVSRQQGGLYWCTADNGLNKATASVRILVQYAPSITLSEKNYNVTEGKDLQLHCASDGRPPPTVTWKKIAGLSNSAYPQDQRLTIRNATRTDAGFYRCTAVNGIGKQATASMHVNVFYPPSIIRGPINQTANETQDLRLFCNATGNPQPQITWSKGSVRIGKPSIAGVLIVNSVNKTHSGVYQCIASNGISSNAYAWFTVTVNYKPRAMHLTTTATKNTAIEGRTVTFHCDADSVPSSLLELRFKGAPLGYFSNGKFTIAKVNASYQGPYECVARNILGTGQIATLNLNVLVPPSINFVSHNATANETDDVTLFCNATGNPRPNITWTFLSGPEPRDTIRIRGKLTLPNVTKSQTGVYLCTASNNVMNAKTAKVHVTINYKPEIKEGASAQNIMSWINHKTEIMCEAEGVPVPEITWSRKGTVTSSKEFSSRVSTLTFTPQEPRDFGAYVCQARNLLGSMEKRTIIEMLVEPEAPEILRVEPGFNDLKIYWKASVTNPASPVLDYLVQVKKKDESIWWKNCTQIETFPTSFMCFINDLKSDTMYIVRVAGRNVVGYSEFTEKKAQTKAKEMGTFGRQKGMSGYTVDCIIAGVIGFSVLVVVIIAIVTNRRPCHKGNTERNGYKSSNAECVGGHDNTAFAENPKTDVLDEQV